jgi:hypothetical protein
MTQQSYKTDKKEKVAILHQAIIACCEVKCVYGSQSFGEAEVEIWGGQF